jgi:NAD(P)-dependent dehydrogenase (short-subunit alcohol dehydrogenase family)
MTVVLVTGGSSGIGLATVRRLAAAGDRVFSVARSPERAGIPDGVTPIALDLNEPDAAERAVRTVTDAAGRLDVLVNNAGIAPLVPLAEATDAQAREVFEINVFAPMRLARAAIPVMRGQGGGRIINLTSVNDIAPAVFGGWYSASKAALSSLSVVLDAEVRGFGISVTVVAPGLYATEMASRLPLAQAPEGSAYGKAFEGIRRETAAELAQAGDPDEVAVAIQECILASDPPARIVVGTDGQKLDAQMRATSAEDLASLLRDMVAGLA